MLIQFQYPFNCSHAHAVTAMLIQSQPCSCKCTIHPIAVMLMNYSVHPITAMLMQIQGSSNRSHAHAITVSIQSQSCSCTYSVHPITTMLMQLQDSSNHSHAHANTADKHIKLPKLLQICLSRCSVIAGKWSHNDKYFTSK